MRMHMRRCQDAPPLKGVVDRAFSFSSSFSSFFSFFFGCMCLIFMGRHVFSCSYEEAWYIFVAGKTVFFFSGYFFGDETQLVFPLL